MSAIPAALERRLGNSFMPRDPDRPMSPNERAWLEFIRMASNDCDPVPTLQRVQALRRIFSG